MEKLLTSITQTIQKYQDLRDKLDFDEAGTLADMMKDLSSDLFFLEKHLDDERRAYYKTIYKLRQGGLANSSAETEAKYLHPEKRMLETFKRAANDVLQAIRSHISLLKHDRE